MVSIKGFAEMTTRGTMLHTQAHVVPGEAVARLVASQVAQLFPGAPTSSYDEKNKAVFFLWGTSERRALQVRTTMHAWEAQATEGIEDEIWLKLRTGMIRSVAEGFDLKAYDVSSLSESYAFFWQVKANPYEAFRSVFLGPGSLGDVVSGYKPLNTDTRWDFELSRAPSTWVRIEFSSEASQKAVADGVSPDKGHPVTALVHVQTQSFVPDRPMVDQLLDVGTVGDTFMQERILPRFVRPLDEAMKAVQTS
ncbi:MAG TPA: hypothetical protein VMH22_03785 [bacterium]|nr:hypothetical protein [bacterium]